MRAPWTVLLFAVVLWSWSAVGLAQADGKAGSLEDLLEEVEGGFRGLDEQHQARIREFEAQRDKQAELLEQARTAVAAEEQRAQAYEREFAASEERIDELRAQLTERLGTLGEVIGTVRQVSGETRALLEESLVSAQLQDRTAFLQELSQSEDLPAIESLEKLWFLLQQEMTESGQVERFEAPVLDPDGAEHVRQVVRIGTFNAVADEKYLMWLPEVERLSELPRQPDPAKRARLSSLEKGSTGRPVVWIDPSRGSLLSLLVETPSTRERLSHGGLIGYIILSMGAAAFALGVLRLLYLAFVSFKVRRQQRHPDDLRPNNPLGRVLAVGRDDSPEDLDTLEHRMEQVLLQETGRLERYLWLVQVVSFVAPLLGLLGTVTGMIRTFQAITLFGAGDPKLMAGGISEALVTTALGLIVAVPLVLLYSGLRSLSRRTGDVLYEQGAGLIALRAEGGKGE